MCIRYDVEVHLQVTLTSGTPPSDLKRRIVTSPQSSDNWYLAPSRACYISTGGHRLMLINRFAWTQCSEALPLTGEEQNAQLRSQDLFTVLHHCQSGRLPLKNLVLMFPHQQ
jgi:hypothetical protein